MAVHMSVDKEAIIKATGRVNALLDCWGANYPPPPPQIPCGQVPNLQKLPKKDGTGRGGAFEAINSRVWPTQSRNGREQGFPGYPIWNRSDILNHNTLQES